MNNQIQPLLIQQRLAGSEQFLNPEAIYTLNKRLNAIIDTSALNCATDIEYGKDYWVTPVLYRKSSRTWHSACVIDAWGVQEGDELDFTGPHKFIGDALKLIARLWVGHNEENGSVLTAQLAGREEFFGEKSDFKECHISFVLHQNYLIEDRKYEKAHCYIENCLRHLNSQFQSDDIHYFSSEQGGLDYLATQLGLISEERQVKQEECQALIRNLLLLYHGFKIHRDLLLAGILYRNTNKYSKQGIAWIEGIWTDDNLDELELDLYLTQNGSQNARQKDSQMSSSNTLNSAETITFHELASQRGAAFLSELANIFYLTRIGQESEVTVNKMPLLVLPVYDCWIGPMGCGNLWGCLILTFCDNNTLTTFKQNLLPYFRQQTRDLANSLTNSAMTRIASRDIIPPYDLIEVFLNCLVATQDWEWISVFTGKEDDNNQKLLYCYHRPVKQNSYSEDAQWKRCTKKCTPQCHGNSDILKWEGYDFAPWNQDIIPELTEEEIASFGDLTFHFGYPASTWIPGRSNLESTREIFELTLIEQQLRVLRTLVTKVQSRRSALRNAVVSIMGRNMSHNIGSHVLARYAAQGSADNPLQVKQFLRYLQERMDFIADISTTEVFYNLPVRFYADTMVGLTGKRHKCGSYKQQPQEILLQNISGLNKVAVDVISKNDSNQDFVYDSAGGRLGMQAVYVILENIARNTAKHGQSDSSNINASVEQQSESMFRLIFDLPPGCTEHNTFLLQREKLESHIAPKDIQSVRLNGERIQPYYMRQLAANGQVRIEGDKVGWKTRGQNVFEIECISGCTSEHWENISLTPENDIILNIKVEEGGPTGDKELLRVVVWDKRGGCISKDKKGNIIWLPDIINDKLKQPMIASHGGIEPNNWGIREIFLAASYLREVPLSDLESREHWPGVKHNGFMPIVEAVAVDLENDNVVQQKDIIKGIQNRYSLGYCFYLKKRQLLLEVAQQGGNWATENEGLGISVQFAADQEVQNNKGFFYSYLLLPEQRIRQYTKIEDKINLPIMTLSRQEMDIVFDQSKVDSQLASAWWHKHYTERLALEKDTFSLTRSGEDPQRKGAVKSLSAKELQTLLIDDPNQSRKHLLFDDHGSLYTALKKTGNDPFHLLSNLSFYEPFRKKNQQYELIYSDSLSGIEFDLKSAALSNVIIIDERLQAALPENYEYDGMTFQQLFPLMGIYLPHIDAVNLDEIGSQNDKLFEWLLSLHKQLQKQGRKNTVADFIVIHQTIIDKLRKANTSFEDDFLEAARKLGCSDRIIVCSGRGNPRESLPDFARFIPVSAILQWTVNSPSKYHLVNLLCHARKPENNGGQHQ